MPKTPDEIKKGLEHCINGTSCRGCPYCEECAIATDCNPMHKDLQDYIQQLEAIAKSTEQIRWERDIAIGQLKELGLSLGEKVDGKTPRWISVVERLPAGEGWVLAIGLLLKRRSKGNYGWCVPHVAEYRHGRWCDSDGMLPDLEDRSLKITHWMPLPEPPEESP